MKKFISALAVVAALVTGSPAFAAVEIGKPAPDISFKDIAGNDYSLKNLKGQTVVLEWTNPGCPFVHKFYDKGDMPRIQGEARKDPKLVWISVNSSAPEKEGFFPTDAEAKEWFDKNDSKATAYVRDPSGAFGKLYGAKTTPHMFVIDKEGNIAYAGGIDSVKSADQEDIAKAENYVLKTLEALAKGEKLAVTSSEPYGCSVKYAQ